MVQLHEAEVPDISADIVAYMSSTASKPVRFAAAFKKLDSVKFQ